MNTILYNQQILIGNYKCLSLIFSIQPFEVHCAFLTDFLKRLYQVLSVHYYRPITNERENVYSKFLLIKSSKKYYIFSSACYLIIWLMISPKIFEKKGILKI